MEEQIKIVPKTRIFSFTWSIFLISSILVACSPVNIHRVTVKKASSYKFSKSKAGLMVSVDPFFEEDRLKEFFGANLLSKGILPVLVVFENVKADDGFVLLTDRANLVVEKLASKADTTGFTYEKQVNEASRTLSGTEALMAPMVIVAPIVGVATLPFLFAAEDAYKDAVDVAKNMETVKLVDKTVYPKGSHSGFLYFKLENEDDAGNIEAIQLNARNIRTKESVMFTIGIGRQ